MSGSRIFSPCSQQGLVWACFPAFSSPKAAPSRPCWLFSIWYSLRCDENYQSRVILVLCGRARKTDMVSWLRLVVSIFSLLGKNHGVSDTEVLKHTRPHLFVQSLGRRRRQFFLPLRFAFDGLRNTILRYANLVSFLLISLGRCAFWYSSCIRIWTCSGFVIIPFGLLRLTYLKYLSKSAMRTGILSEDEVGIHAGHIHIGKRMEFLHNTWKSSPC